MRRTCGIIATARQFEAMREGVANLGQHPFGGEQMELRSVGNFGGLRVAFLAGIKQREKIKRVGKDGRHFFGSPRK